MREHLAGVSHLSFINANHQLAGHMAVGRADVVHAHEAKAVHWAFLHWLWKRTPYVLTRRVDTPVRQKTANRWCYRSAARRVAISRIIQRHLEGLGWGEVELIPSAFSSQLHREEVARQFRDEFPGKFLVGHAGAVVDRHKGQRVLLEAARLLEKRLPDIHFIFLGDGEDREILERESADQPNVTWLGFKENIADYLAGLDVFAFPSRNEGLGSVLLDVMDLGIPIIAAEVGGIPDIVHHEKTGLLMTNESAEALADGLVRLYEQPSLRQSLSNVAREQLEAYSAQAMAASYWALYSKTKQ